MEIELWDVSAITVGGKLNIDRGYGSSVRSGLSQQCALSEWTMLSWRSSVDRSCQMRRR